MASDLILQPEKVDSGYDQSAIIGEPEYCHLPLKRVPPWQTGNTSSGTWAIAFVAKISNSPHKELRMCIGLIC